MIRLKKRWPHWLNATLLAWMQRQPHTPEPGAHGKRWAGLDGPPVSTDGTVLYWRRHPVIMHQRDGRGPWLINVPRDRRAAGLVRALQELFPTHFLRKDGYDIVSRGH
jgi:hypothetical protein